MCAFRRCKGVAFVAGVVVVLASTTPGYADPIYYLKLEFAPLAYGQGTMHISTEPAHSHPFIPAPPVGPGPECFLISPPPAPSFVWETPFVIGELAPGRVFLRSAPTNEHIVAPHPPEEIPGPPFRYRYRLSVSQPPAAAGFATLSLRWLRRGAVRRHPGQDHEDHHVVAMAAFWFIKCPLGVCFETRGYVHGSVGIHLPQGAGFGRGAIMKGPSQLPPNDSQAVGSAAMVVDQSQSTFTMLLMVAGITPDQVTAAHIHLGSEDQTGPPIVDLGPPAAWQPVPNGVGMARAVDGESFPRQFLPWLLAGQAYVDIHTLQFPDGEIRGQITDERGDRQSDVVPVR